MKIKLLIIFGLIIGLSFMESGSARRSGLIWADDLVDRTSAFLTACGDGDQLEVAKLLADGVDVNATNHLNETALILASVKGNLSIVKLLLEKRAQVNAVDQWGGTALQRACRGNFFEIAAVLVDYGADVNLADQTGQTPLFVAYQMGNYQIARFLLVHGADARRFEAVFQKTALHLVSADGYEQGVRLLIANGAVVNAMDKEGQTPLHYACARGQEATAKVLLANKADLFARDYQGAYALHYACLNGQLQTAQFLIAQGLDVDEPDRNLKTPLHYACYSGQTALVNALLKLKANLSALDSSKGTALHYASYGGRRDIAALLLSRGITVDAVDNQGITPLHLACYRGQQRVVELLIAKGAKLNTVDKLGKTPLDLAKQAGHQTIVKLLTARQAREGAETKKTFWPYYYENYTLDKRPFVIKKVKLNILNTHSSFWNEGSPEIERLFGTFNLYIDPLHENQERIKQVCIVSKDGLDIEIPQKYLSFKDGVIMYNSDDNVLTDNSSLFALRDFVLEVETYDGRFEVCRFDLPEPGALQATKSFVYSPSYSGAIGADYVAALQTAKIINAKLTDTLFDMEFVVKDLRVFNGNCIFLDSSRNSIGWSNKFVNPYSWETSSALNRGKVFNLNNKVNRLVLPVSEIKFKSSKSVADIRYVMITLNDGAQFADSENPEEYLYFSSSKLYDLRPVSSKRRADK
jgi:ankyrin repeat protein